MSKEAMKLALEALETYHGYMEPLTTVFGGPRVPAEQSTTGKVETAITSLRQALEEALAKQEQGEPVIDKSAAIRIATALGWTPPKQEQGEPVAWTDENVIAWCLARGIKAAEGTPQQRKPLTDEQIDTIANSFSTWMFPVETQRRDCDRAIARAIEAAHGIKE